MYSKGLCTAHYLRQWRAARRGVTVSAPVATAAPSMSSPPSIEPVPILYFRAWHRNLRQMFPVTAIFFPTSNDAGRVELQSDGLKGSLDDVVLMVRANFAVKSGALYDGDIIRDERYEPSLFRIAFRQEVGWDCFEVGGSSDAWFILPEDGPHIEVVGNIYENSDLLA